MSALESHGSAECEQADVICRLTAADVLHVAADDLLQAVSNSHVTAVRNSTQESSCAGTIVPGDMPTTAASSPTPDISYISPGLHIGQVCFKAKLRVNVETLAELELWQKDFAEKSKTTMRYANVSICTGKKTLYKVNMAILCVDYLPIFTIGLYDLACMCKYLQIHAGQYEYKFLTDILKALLRMSLDSWLHVSQLRTRDSL